MILHLMRVRMLESKWPGVRLGYTSYYDVRYYPGSCGPWNSPMLGSEVAHLSYRCSVLVSAVRGLYSLTLTHLCARYGGVMWPCRLLHNDCNSPLVKSRRLILGFRPVGPCVKVAVCTRCNPLA